MSFGVSPAESMASRTSGMAFLMIAARELRHDSAVFPVEGYLGVELVDDKPLSVTVNGYAGLIAGAFNRENLHLNLIYQTAAGSPASQFYPTREAIMRPSVRDAAAQASYSPRLS